MGDDPNAQAPQSVLGHEERVEDAYSRLRENLDWWLSSPGLVVVSFRMTRHGWTDDWQARFEPDPVCSSCGQHVEDATLAPIS